MVNLNAIYSDPGFQKACVNYEQYITNYDEGIGRFGNTEQELVLDISQLPISSIHSFGGYSKDEADLLKMFSLEKYERLPDRRIRREFERGLKKSKQTLGPRWVSGNGKERAVTVLLEAVKVLKPYKRP